jgi:hypothetical protein
VLVLLQGMVKLANDVLIALGRPPVPTGIADDAHGDQL